jgi:6-phosphogluconolactonase
MSSEHKFESRDAASIAAAARIAGIVNARLLRDSSTTIAVCGGTSPVRCFETLSAYELEWQDVRVVLTDERWVPSDHEDSNERLVRETLLQDKASGGNVLSLYQSDLSVDERCDSLQTELKGTQFAAALVGMGADGHFASLFADAAGLKTGLNTQNRLFYMPVRTAASPYPRISMTLGALLQSDEILLLFFGDEKLAVYEKAKAGDTSYPIAALLEQQVVPVNLYWAP